MFCSLTGPVFHLGRSSTGPLLARAASLGLLSPPLVASRYRYAALRHLLRSLLAHARPAAGLRPGPPTRFLTMHDGRCYGIEARPLSWNRLRLTGLVAVPAGELEVERAGRSRVRWSRPRSFAQARRVPGGGLYIIEKSRDGVRWTPDYAGQTKSYGRRLLVHARTRARSRGGMKYRVRVGQITDLKPPANLANLKGKWRERYLRRLKLAVEHGTIRSLLRRGIALGNRSSIEPLVAGPAGFAIRHRGGPKYLRDAGVRAGRTYELAPWTRS